MTHFYKNCCFLRRLAAVDANLVVALLSDGRVEEVGSLFSVVWPVIVPLNHGYIESKVYVKENCTFLRVVSYHPQSLCPTRAQMPFSSLCIQLVARSLTCAGSFTRSVLFVGTQHYHPLKPLKHTPLIFNPRVRVVTCILRTLWTQCHCGNKYQRTTFLSIMTKSLGHIATVTALWPVRPYSHQCGSHYMVTACR